MRLPRRPILLALLALTLPLPALAGSDDAPSGPAALSVSTTLGSCGVAETDVVCQLNVSFNELENATSYTASVTRADGSVVDYGSVAPGGTSLWVPYVGAGNYSVSITAYGTPDEPGEEGEKIATEVSSAKSESKDGELETGGAELEADAEGRDGSQGADAEVEGANGNGEIETDPACADADAAPAPTVPPEPPKPPADLDPANPDEDGDKIDDAQELVEYERLVAEREAALAAAEAAELPESID